MIDRKALFGRAFEFTQVIPGSKLRRVLFDWGLCDSAMPPYECLKVRAVERRSRFETET